MMNYRKISFEFALDFKPLLYLLNYTTQNQMKHQLVSMFKNYLKKHTQRTNLTSFKESYFRYSRTFCVGLGSWLTLYFF